MRTLVINHNLLGDALFATPGLAKLKETTQELVMVVGYEPHNDIFEGTPCVDKVLRATGEQTEQLRRKYSASQGKMVVVDTINACILDINRAFSLAQQQTRFERLGSHLIQTSPHLSEALAAQMGVSIDSTHYHVKLDERDFDAAKVLRSTLGTPLVLCAALSSSCASRKDGKDSGNPPNKMLSADTWNQIVSLLGHEVSFAFLGGPGEEPLKVDAPWLIGYPIRTVAALCKLADAVVSIDTGIMHVAQAVDANLVAICAAVLSTLTSCCATGGKYHCVDHSLHSTTPGGISTIDASEVVDGIRKVLC